MAEAEKIECPACGNEMQSRAGICGKCGATVDGDVARIVARPNPMPPIPGPRMPSNVDEFLTGIFDGR